MKINVVQLKKEIGSRQPFTFSCDIDQLFDDSREQWTSGKVTVDGSIVNNGRLLEVEGNIHVRALLSCGRCLETFESDFVLPFHEMFLEDTVEVSMDNEDVTGFHGDEINIQDAVHDTIILSEPLRTVCSEDCLGLCSSCGVNLNKQTCTCQRENIDPRLAALQKFLEKD